MKKLQIPQKLVLGKFYVHENAAVNLSKIYFLKNPKKTLIMIELYLLSVIILNKAATSSILLKYHQNLLFDVSFCFVFRYALPFLKFYVFKQHILSARIGTSS